MNKYSFQQSPTPSGGMGGLGSILSGLGNIATTIIQNRGQKKREQQRRQYDVDMWEKVQAYNHPLEQMKRLTEAGLNPNLIYGSSPGSATGNAGAIASGQAPDYTVKNPVTSFMDTRVKQAQSNNLKSQSNLNTANAMKSIEQSGLAKSQANQINKLLSGQLEIQQEQIKQAKIGTFLKTLEKTGKDKYYLSNLAAQTNKNIADGEIAQASISLAKLNDRLANSGIRPTDPLYVRLMAQIFGIDISKPKVQDEKDMKTFIESMINKNK